MVFFFCSSQIRKGWDIYRFRSWVIVMSREDDGSMLAYVQQVQENNVFRVGERVRFPAVGGISRILH
jgi:outer membrane lipoprotein SlyB